MKNCKKIIAGVLLATLTASSTAFASETVSSIKQEAKFEYSSFTAVVETVNSLSQSENSKIVSLKDEEGSPINMIINEDTYIIGKETIEIGDTVSGNLPMLMIYPPLYRPEVVVVHNSDRDVKVDTFNEDLVSSDNMLKLNIPEFSGDTEDSVEVVTKEGKGFIGDLRNKRLAVIYKTSTKSIPAQTVPDKIIVLSEVNKEEELERENEKEESSLFDSEIVPIIINKNKESICYTKVLTVQTPTLAQATMLPLKLITNELGISVKWLGANKPIQIGESVFIKIGEIPKGLRVAPQLINTEADTWETYVPLELFTELLGFESAYKSEEGIIINK